jgi:hypothetical protein
MRAKPAKDTKILVVNDFVGIVVFVRIATGL